MTRTRLMISMPCRADAIQEPPRTFFRAIRQIGPGLILAASIVGTGELINTTGLGAKAGFSLLWLILLSCVIKVFVQVELGRYAITHGKTTLAAFDTLPGPEAGGVVDLLALADHDADHPGPDRRDGGDRRPGGPHGLPRGVAGHGRRRGGSSSRRGARSSRPARSTSGRG